MLRSLLDGLVFSSTWVALAAAALCLAVVRAMDLPLEPAVPGLVFNGTLAIYGLDRLRDLERDRRTAPQRSAFVARNEGALRVLCGLAALAAGACAWWVGPVPLLALAPALALGLLHRRAKRFVLLKSSYITLAWLLVVVAFPAVQAGEGRAIGWVALLVGLGVQANASASNVRDAEAALPTGRALALARVLAWAGAGCAWAAPAEVRALGLVPLAVGIALVGFRAEERYGLAVVDGALLWGGVAAFGVHALVG